MLTLNKGISSVLLTGALAGCVTEGKDFHSDTAWIKESATKRDDVKLMLGEPFSVGNSSGRATWTYGYYRYKLIGKSLQKELKLYWNPDGTVNTYAFTSSFPEDTSNTGPKVGGAPVAKPDF